MIYFIMKDRENDEILLTLENISFVTSYRELIDENGEILPPSTLNMKIAKETTLFEGKELGNYMLKT